MDTTKRTIAKAVSWQLFGLLVMALIGYAVTGSVTQGGAMAAITSGLGFVNYFLHERLWAQIRWGRRETT